MSSTFLKVDEKLRQAFESAWMAGTIPEIEPHLPCEDDPAYLGTLEELVHIDLELRWKRRSVAADPNGKAAISAGPCVEHYLNRFRALRQHDLLVRLLQQEYWVRSRYAESPLLSDYCERFPDLGDESTMADLLQVEAAPQEARHTPGGKCGRYLLMQLHARGGFGEVWRAYDPLLDREVALKTLSDRQSRQAEAKRRFVAEARTTAQLEHPGVVSVHDLNHVEGEEPYYAMRFLGGQTLAEAVADLHRDQVQPDEDRNVLRLRLLNAFLTVARTVEFAHSRNIVHRDLKPQNVILGEYGETAILDWGLAKRRFSKTDQTEVENDSLDRQTDAQSSSLGHGFSEDLNATRDGTVLGTPAYMSPEQGEGLVKQVDELSDQYSLGVMLFNVLTGTTPAECGKRYVRTSVHRIRPRAIVPTVSPAIDAICMKAMSFDRADRYPSVSALTRDLELFLADEPVSAYAEPWPARLGRWVRHHRTMVSTVVTTLLVAGLLLTVGIVLLIEANRRLSRQRNRAESALVVANENLYDHRVEGAFAELWKNNMVRAETMLLACPESQRDWEWNYIRSEIDRHKPDYVLPGHRSIPRALTFSGDRRFLAVAYYDGIVVVWDCFNWRERARLRAGTEAKRMLFDADGRHLTVLGREPNDRSVLVEFDLLTSSVVRKKILPGEGAFDLCYDQARRLVVSAGRKMTLIDPETWDIVRNQEVGGRTVRQTVKAMDSETGEPRFVVRHRTGFSFCDQHGEQLSVLGFGGRLHDLDYSAPSNLVAVGDDYTVSLWSSSHPERSPRALIGHTDAVRAVAFAPDGRKLASGGHDRTIRIWDVNRRTAREVIRSHTSHVRCLAFSADGEYLASAGDEGDVFVWRCETLVRPQFRGRVVAFSPDGTRLVTAEATRREGQIRIWNLESQQMVAEFKMPWVLHTAISSDNRRFAAASGQGRVKVWDVEKGEACFEFAPGGGACDGISFGNRDEQLAAVFNGHVFLLDHSGQVDQQIEIEQVHHLYGYQVEFPDSGDELIVGFPDGQIEVITMGTGERHRFRADPRALVAMNLSSDERTLITSGDDGFIRLWNWKTGTTISELEFGASWILGLELTSNARRLITGSEHTITFWDVPRASQVLSIPLGKCVSGMALSANGRWLAVADAGGTVHLWESAQE